MYSNPELTQRLSALEISEGEMNRLAANSFDGSELSS
jgi:hypothetical protein